MGLVEPKRVDKAEPPTLSPAQVLQFAGQAEKFDHDRNRWNNSCWMINPEVGEGRLCKRQDSNASARLSSD